MLGSRWSRSPGVILGVLTTVNALNYLDRYVAAATLPLILADLAISDAQGGVLQSLFIVAYSLACVPAGWLGDVGSRLRLAAIGVFVWSLATVASGLAPTYGWLLLARAVIGVGEASYAVVTPSLLSDCYPAERRARMLGVFYAAIPIGAALGYIVGGVIGEAHGWRTAFFIAGAPGAVLAFLLLRLTEPPRGARDATSVGATPLGLGPSLRALARRRPSVYSWWPQASPERCLVVESPVRWRVAGPAPTLPCRAGHCRCPSCSRSSRCWHPSQPCSGRLCSSHCSCSSSTWGRSTRPWPTCCPPSCGRVGSP